MPSYDNYLELTESTIQRMDNDLLSIMNRELAGWLEKECERVMGKSAKWERDYSGESAYEESVENYREKWKDTLGLMEFDADPNPEWEPAFENEKAVARWIYIDLAMGLKARAILALPKNKKSPLPLVIAQHGNGSLPTSIFGIYDPTGAKHSMGMKLLKKGYAVLAPANICYAKPRKLKNRVCLILGTTLKGLESGKIKRLLDYVTSLSEIDESRVGMWGLSYGGAYTMFLAPLDKRIKASIVCGFFNDRLRKMVVPSRQYSCFLDAPNEGIWIPGWFKNGFSDSNLLSLVCPRAVQIQEGKSDGIGWWELQEAEFKKLKTHYEKLDIGDRAEYIGHSGGHEMLPEKGIEFLGKWL